MSGTSVDKCITYQARVMGIRKVSKVSEDVSENDKAEIQDSTGRDTMNTEIALV